MTMQTKKGFTLIELLVVIAIIGILSAIGLVALNGGREKARDSKRQDALGQIRSAMALYFDGQDPNAYYSTPTGAVEVDRNNPDAGFQAAFASFIPTLPDLPISTGNADNGYWYINGTSSEPDQHFALMTKLESHGQNWYVVNDLGYGGIFEDATAAGLDHAAITCTGSNAASGKFEVCQQTPTATP